MTKERKSEFIPYRDDEFLINKKYENHFAKITLTQQVNNNPVVFAGPGSISQNETGQLVLKVYHLYTGDARERDFLPRGIAGELITANRLFRLRAIDMSGKEWTADDVWVHYEIKHPSVGVLIKISINEIKSEATRKENNEFNIDVMAIGKYDTPHSESLFYPDGSERWTKHVINHEGLNIVTICDSAFIRIQIMGQDKFYKDDICDLVLEALSVAVGKRITISRSAICLKGKALYKIMGVSSPGRDSLNQPIPTRSPHDGDSFDDFVGKYLGAFLKPFSVFFMNWKRINCVSGSLVDDIALVQCAAIESVLKEYYAHCGMPSEGEKVLIDKAINLVSESENELKVRIAGHIRNMGKQNARKALIELKDKGSISEAMYRAWNRRQSLAHGSIISAGDFQNQQKAVDELNAVLGLFYRLLLIHIGYTKQYYDYSQKGHPILSMSISQECY